jgi:hypothetical protein
MFRGCSGHGFVASEKRLPSKSVSWFAISSPTKAMKPKESEPLATILG